ncbi:MAG: heme-binding beta-barrel domain-containing protein [Deltaproteobacteria bacterium]|nr:heme-binding beta-barrel domain-containing protein [Deltaproteobacteria bacterium]
MAQSPVDTFTDLLGTYHGEQGEGVCPSGQLTAYAETLTLRRQHDWVWFQFSAIEPSGQVLHEEHGVFRPTPDGKLEASIVMNSGRMEFAKGGWNGATLLLDSSRFLNDRLGVLATRRRYEFRPQACSRTFWLATPQWPTLTLHMWGTLHRVSVEVRAPRG